MGPVTAEITLSQRVAGAALAGFGGICMAVQGRVNGQLGHVMRDGVFAALISTVIGLALLVIGVAARPESRRGAGRLVAALRAGKLPWWQSLGGLSGAYVISAQGITITSLGVAVFTVAVVSGMVVASLAVDRAGLGPGGARPITTTRALAAGLAVVAVLVAVSNKFGDPAGLWLAVLPAIAGLGIAWQAAVNGRVRQAADDVVVPTMVNFLTASAALIVACATDVALRGWPLAPPGQWWLYLGGLLGVFAVGTAVFAVRLIGVLVLSLSSVAGQLVGAVGLDIVVPTAGGLSVVSIVGATITMVAVAVAGARR
jgi:bacterial/archaeal transporter family-2 protein